MPPERQDKMKLVRRYVRRFLIKKIKWIQNNKKKSIYAAAAVMVILGSMLLLGGGTAAPDTRKAQKPEPVSEADCVKELDEKTERSVEKLEEEKAKIEQVIAADAKYGARLGELYTQYPQMRKLFLNREAYPDWLLDYFITHEEAVDWVVDYPEYEGKSEEEIKAAADPEEYFEQNGIPLYLQWDKTWGYAPYGSGIIAIDGCGPTCLAMVVTGLTGDVTMTPKKVADFSVENGFFAEGAGTSWSLMDAGARKLGLRSRQIEKWTEDAVIEELKAGHPMICSMGAGDFTEKGHFIVLCGITDEGKVILNDPNSRVNTEKEWEVRRLLDQMKAMWAFQPE